MCSEPGAFISSSLIAHSKMRSYFSNPLFSTGLGSVLSYAIVLLLPRPTPELLGLGMAGEAGSPVCPPSFGGKQASPNLEIRDESFSVACLGVSFLSLLESLFPLLWFFISFDHS